MMRDANALKEGIQLLIFPSPVSLHSENFSIKLAFNPSLEFMKFLKNFRFMTKQINPCKLAKIINEANVITVLPTEVGAGPHTSENTSSKGLNEILVDLG